MITTVRRRQFDTRAVRWDGANEAEVREIGAEFCALDSPSDDDPEATAQLVAAPHNTWMLVYDGDWIVARPGGGFVRMSSEEFAAEFEVVTP